MTDVTTQADTLPLLVATPRAWADHVLAQPLQLLNDHAHLEKKAASNALDLLARWPRHPYEAADPQPDADDAQMMDRWVRICTGVARDEVEHLRIVLRLLHQRGGKMHRMHRNGYAAALRKHVRLGDGPRELVDRLMVSALIEARSCERFEALAAWCEDTELRNLYRGLCASERGHFKVFIELASYSLPTEEVDVRWQQWLEIEAQVLTDQPPSPTMHSWVEAEGAA